MVEKDDKLFEIDPRQYKAELDRAEGTSSNIEAHVRSARERVPARQEPLESTGGQPGRARPVRVRLTRKPRPT